MSKSGRLRLQDFRSIGGLVGDCRDLGDDCASWRARFIEGLAGLAGADLGHSGEMGKCETSAPEDLGVACWGWQAGFAELETINSQLEQFRRTPEYSPTLVSYLRTARTEDGICLSRRELVEDRPWYASPDYRVIQKTFRADHILWCFRQIPGARAGECSGVILNRREGAPDFGPRERSIVREAHAALSPLIGGPLARYADPSPLNLPPRARQILACMLEGDGDKQIALRLALSTHTVNQYAKAIYRHFRVQSRPQLLARWVRRGWGPRPWAGSEGP